MKKSNALAVILVGLMTFSTTGSAMAASSSIVEAKKAVAKAAADVKSARANERDLRTKLHADKAKVSALKNIIASSTDAAAVAKAKDALAILVKEVETLRTGVKQAKVVRQTDEQILVTDEKVVEIAKATF